MPISLVTDSTADLPAHLLQQFNIRVVPSVLVIGADSFADGIDITRDEFYRRLPALNPPPTTAAPAVGDYEAAYASLPDGPIISIHTAATLSGIYNAARLASQKFGDRVHLIDSGSLTFGIGWQVLAAAEAIAAAGSLEAALAAIAHTRRRLRTFALLDTMTNLQRSGRISLLTASIGAVLQVKPLIELANGQLMPRARERTRRKALADMTRRVQALGKLERLAVLYTDNCGYAEELRAQLESQCASPALLCQVTPAIGTHIGPNAVGVAAVTVNG